MWYNYQKMDYYAKKCSKPKKRISAFIISLMMASANMENISLVLNWTLCIHYPVWIKKNNFWDLINSNNKINAMTSIYLAKLSLKVCYINVKAQKIDNSIIKTFGIVLVNFQIKDKLNQTE